MVDKLVLKTVTDKIPQELKDELTSLATEINDHGESYNKIIEHIHRIKALAANRGISSFELNLFAIQILKPIINKWNYSRTIARHFDPQLDKKKEDEAETQTGEDKPQADTNKDKDIEDNSKPQDISEDKDKEQSSISGQQEPELTGEKVGFSEFTGGIDLDMDLRIEVIRMLTKAHTDPKKPRWIRFYATKGIIDGIEIIHGNPHPNGINTRIRR